METDACDDTQETTIHMSQNISTAATDLPKIHSLVHVATGMRVAGHGESLDLFDGENWLRLVSRKGSCSVLDPTQISQDTRVATDTAIPYPSILSLAELGQIDAPTEDCYLMLDVDGPYLTIKDMRDTVDEEECDNGKDDEDGDGDTVSTLEVVLARHGSSSILAASSLEPLPRRQMRVLHHKDRICTRSSGRLGLVLEYRHEAAIRTEAGEEDDPSQTQDFGTSEHTATTQLTATQETNANTTQREVLSSQGQSSCSREKLLSQAPSEPGQRGVQQSCTTYEKNNPVSLLEGMITQPDFEDNDNDGGDDDDTVDPNEAKQRALSNSMTPVIKNKGTNKDESPASIYSQLEDGDSIYGETQPQSLFPEVSREAWSGNVTSTKRLLEQHVQSAAKENENPCESQANETNEGFSTSDTVPDESIALFKGQCESQQKVPAEQTQALPTEPKLMSNPIDSLAMESPTRSNHSEPEPLPKSALAGARKALPKSALAGARIKGKSGVPNVESPLGVKALSKITKNGPIGSSPSTPTTTTPAQVKETQSTCQRRAANTSFKPQEPSAGFTKLYTSPQSYTTVVTNHANDSLDDSVTQNSNIRKLATANVELMSTSLSKKQSLLTDKPLQYESPGSEVPEASKAVEQLLLSPVASPAVSECLITPMKTRSQGDSACEGDALDSSVVDKLTVLESSVQAVESSEVSTNVLVDKVVESLIDPNTAKCHIDTKGFNQQSDSESADLAMPDVERQDTVRISEPPTKKRIVYDPQVKLLPDQCALFSAPAQLHPSNNVALRDNVVGNGCDQDECPNGNIVQSGAVGAVMVKPSAEGQGEMIIDEKSQIENSEEAGSQVEIALTQSVVIAAEQLLRARCDLGLKRSEVNLQQNNSTPEKLEDECGDRNGQNRVLRNAMEAQLQPPSTPKDNPQRKRTRQSDPDTATPANSVSDTSELSARKRPKRTPKSKHPTTTDLRVLVTNTELNAKQIAMVTDLGGVLLDDIKLANTATHVIASDGKHPFRRTPKLMIALNKTANIVKLSWLVESAKASKLLPCEDYFIVDAKAESQYDFCMVQTLDKARANLTEGSPLLHGIFVYVCKGVAGNKAPPENELKLIVEAAGGVWLTRLDDPTCTYGKGRNCVLVIITSSDPKAEKRQLKVRDVTSALRNGAVHKTTAWLFHTMLTQERDI